jgi:hypothetical protein
MEFVSGVVRLRPDLDNGSNKWSKHVAIFLQCMLQDCNVASNNVYLLTSNTGERLVFFHKIYCLNIAVFTTQMGILTTVSLQI